MKNVAIKVFAALCALGMTGCASENGFFPSLVGSDSQENVYANGSNVVNGSYTGTFVGQRVAAFRQELKQLEQAQKSNEKEFEKITANIASNSSLYQKTVSSVENKLQAGTTPGNPNMYAMLQQAQSNVQIMFGNANALDNLSSKTSDAVTSINYLENSIAAAFKISGAVDEDHKQLRDLQNKAATIAQKIAILNDNVTRAADFQQQNAVQASQEVNSLHDSIKTGSSAPVSTKIRSASYTPIAHKSKPIVRSAANVTANRLPLFSVKFNNPNVDYREGLNTAVKSALARKTGAIFDVVAVSNSAEQDKVQQRATKIFNEIVALGANSDNINLNARISEKSPVAEIQVFVR